MLRLTVLPGKTLNEAIKALQSILECIPDEFRGNAELVQEWDQDYGPTFTVQYSRPMMADEVIELEVRARNIANREILAQAENRRHRKLMSKHFGTEGD